jgi:hypothetical protein
MPRFLHSVARRALALGVCAWLLTLASPPVPGFAPAPGGGRAEADPLIPADAGFVVSIHLKQALDAPLIKKHAEGPLNAVLGKETPLGKLAEAAGLDPRKDVETLTVAGVADLDKPRWLAVLRGRFDTDKILSVVAAQAKEHAETLKVIKDGNLQMIAVKDKEGKRSFYAAFADSRTLVVSSTQAQTAAVVARANKAAERVSKEMQAALGKLNSKDAITAALVITDEMKKAVKNSQQGAAAAEVVDPVEAVTAGVELTDAANVTIAIHTQDEAGAALVRKKLDEIRPVLNFLIPQDGSAAGVKEILDTLKIANEKSAVTITLSVTEDALKKASLPAPKLKSPPKEKKPIPKEKPEPTDKP